MQPVVYVHLVFTIFMLAVLYMILIWQKFYQKFYYNKIMLPRYDESYTPSVAIFIPCKGINKHLEMNVASFVEIDYPDYHLYFTIESEKDPAYSVIRNVVKGRRNASIVISGEAETCCQKNHNILSAIEASQSQADVFAFLDSDIPLDAAFLKRLILPLSSKDVTVVTGFRWLHLNEKGFGERFHAFVNSVLWAFVNFLPFKGVWGGMMALRRKDFEALRVADLWRTSVVDDITLSRILLDNKKNVVLVPGCMAETNDVFHNVADGIAWFKRQTMYSKFYLFPSWLFGIVVYVLAAINVLLLLPALVLLIAGAAGGALLFSITTIASFALTILWATLIKKPGTDTHNPFLWFLLAPVNILIAMYAALLSATTNVMLWSGIRYHVNGKGIVTKIERS